MWSSYESEVSRNVHEGVRTTIYEDSVEAGVKSGVPCRLIASGNADGVHKLAALLFSFTDRYLTGLASLKTTTNVYVD